MREYLFHGKRCDNDEWIEGMLARYNPKFEVANLVDDRFDILVPVYTNTVGQYIGLPDKNGKKMFDGDIVKFGDIIGIINYNIGCYCVRTNKPDWKSRNNPAIDIVLNEYENEVEVIGNIHDNPELLEGGE